MDSVINRLRNTVTTVTSTVSQLSVALPGNPVTREYEVSQQIGSGGPGLLWKIYSGFKKSTKQEASIFIFEKKQLERWNKRDKEIMIEILKKGIHQITRLRHPRILTVQYALEESRDSLAFAAEPVFASLANVLGYTENLPEPLSPGIKNYKLFELEIKYGLLQICDGLTFLHRDAKMLHGNLCPESIIINQQGSWKIFGFDFSITSTSTGSELVWNYKDYESDRHPLSQPHLDYMAPEYTTNRTCSPASDMFSLGLLAFTAFNGSKPLVISGGNFSTHKRNLAAFNNLSEGSLQCIPSEMRSFQKRLLSKVPDNRPDSHEFSKFEFLHDEGVNTLNYLDSLFQWDNLQKSKFYKGLADILPKLPQRIRLHRVVPCLSQEFVNPTMVPFALPNVLKIAEWSSNEEYVQHILPYLKDVLKLREPVQILFIFMKNMELLLQKTPPDITKSDILPLIYGSLESDSCQVQELCLSIIPSFAALIDYPAMKNSLLPRIKKLCLSTNILSVRVNCLVCVGKILDHLDKWLVIDFIFPFLTEVPSREPACLMGIIGILKLAATHRKLGFPKELIATKVIPFVFPFTVENGLTVQQFITIMGFLHEMIQIVETEQKAKLEEVDAIARERWNSNQAVMPNSEVGNAIDSSYGGTSHTQNNLRGNQNINTYDYDSFGSGMSSSHNKPHVNSPPAVLSPTSSQVPVKSYGTNSSANGSRDLTSTLIDSNLSPMKYSNSSPKLSNNANVGSPSTLASPSLQNFQLYLSGVNSSPQIMGSMSSTNSLQGQGQRLPSQLQSPFNNSSMGPPINIARPHIQQHNTLYFQHRPQQPGFMSAAPPPTNVSLSQKDIDDFLS